MEKYELDFLEKIIEKFMDEIPLEDLIDLKRTMSQSEIKSYIKESVSEIVKDIAKDSIFPVTNRTIPLKKTYHLKVTVESEEMCAD